MFGCFGRIVGLLILLGVLWAAWALGPSFAESRGWIRADETTAEAPSQAIAEAAAARLSDLLEGRVERMSFTATELESLARFRFEEAWPLGVSDPQIELRDGEVYVSFRVASAWIPVLPELESIRGFFPDTVPIQLRGRILTLEGGDASVLVHRIDAASVPIPRRLFSVLLEPLRLSTRPGLPPEALLVPLPPGLSSVWIEGERLILQRIP